MIFSMTGFGRGEAQGHGLEAVVEVRSFNGRYCEVVARLPRSLSHHEEDLKNVVKHYVSRGRLNVTVTLKQLNDQYLGLKVNRELAHAYVRLFQDLKRELQLEGEVRLEHLLQFTDLISHEEDGEFSEEGWELACTALRKALKELTRMRGQEGQQLAKDLASRIRILDKHIRQIQQISRRRVTQELARLRDRVAALTSLNNMNEDRLEMEIALLADKLDVTEECVRFHSHNTLFLKTLREGGAVGRRLNFLLQEMNREANTIGAKACDAAISHHVVAIKEEVEKLREQVQNIE